MQRYGLQGTPSMIIIDKSGQLRTVAFGQVDEVSLGVQLGLLLAEPDHDPEPEPEPGEAAEVPPDR